MKSGDRVKIRVGNAMFGDDWKTGTVQRPLAYSPGPYPMLVRCDDGRCRVARDAGDIAPIA